MLKIRDTAADLRLSFEQADINASRREQGCGCQTADAPADHDYFVLH
jgi:hypothetical protein